MEAGTSESEVVIRPSMEKPGSDKASWRNLPNKGQLLLVSLCRLSTPLSNACILPYLFDLAKSAIPDPTHPDATRDISRVTGLLVAAFPLGQVATSMLLGRLSDTIGRRPVVLFGLAISIIANFAFGFSKTIGMLCFWRVVSGMANGTVGLLRTMTAELGGRKHQSRVFLAPPVVFNSGRVIALAIGGCLANPVANLPFFFGPSGLFNFSDDPAGVQWLLQYPYALPATFNGVSLAVCLALAFFWMCETLPVDLLAQRKAFTVLGWIQQKVWQTKTHEYALIDVEEKGPDTPSHSRPESSPAMARSRFNDVWSPYLFRRLVAFGLLPLHNASFLHIFPVLLSMPASAESESHGLFFVGGLGLASPAIGIFLAVLGIAGILLQLFLYPRIHALIGTRGVFILAGSLFPLAYITAPFLALLAGSRHSKWVAMATVLFLQVLARTMAIPSSVMLLTQAAPDRSVLGTIHGAGNTLSALASACGPAIAGVILARGIEVGAIALVWWAWLAVISLVSLAWSLTLEIHGPRNATMDSTD